MADNKKITNLAEYSSITAFGKVGWTKDEIQKALPAFLKVYENRPIEDNEFGMRAPHMFATWFLLRNLQPKVVVESGIWRGQGTWLIEETLPESRLLCFDINLTNRSYTSRKGEYFEHDVKDFDWSEFNTNDVLFFFDDHQNAFERLKWMQRMDFKHCIFEDNYPAKQGDCYSLKKCFMGSGFNAYQNQTSLKSSIKILLDRLGLRKDLGIIEPNFSDAEFLKNNLNIYYEFPPIFKLEYTRWGDLWNDQDYPTSSPILTELSEVPDSIKSELPYYNWICHAQLN